MMKQRNYRKSTLLFIVAFIPQAALSDLTFNKEPSQEILDMCTDQSIMPEKRLWNRLTTSSKFTFTELQCIASQLERHNIKLLNQNYFESANEDSWYRRNQDKNAVILSESEYAVYLRKEEGMTGAEKYQLMGKKPSESSNVIPNLGDSYRWLESHQSLGILASPDVH